MVRPHWRRSRQFVAGDFLLIGLRLQCGRDFILPDFLIFHKSVASHVCLPFTFTTVNKRALLRDKTFNQIQFLCYTKTFLFVYFFI